MRMPMIMSIESSTLSLSSNSNTDGLAAIVSKLDNLGRDMKKLKENVHAIQVGCKICEGPHLDKECPLNEEVKQVETKYEEFGRQDTTLVLIIDHLMERRDKVETTEVLQHNLPPTDQNPQDFTLPCTIGNINFYAMADLGASVNVLSRNIFEYLGLRNLSETKMLVEIADIRKKAPLGIVKDILVKIDKFLFPFDFIILNQTPNSTVILGRPFLATIHALISAFEKEYMWG
ncbi:putative reverse transcriptase domain-containing protein [Tanacetum coccineum]